MGIVEDSATGTAAGPLACQLVRHGIVKDGTTMVIEQGYEMKRPSLLRVEVNDKECGWLAAVSKSLMEHCESSKQSVKHQKARRAGGPDIRLRL